MSTTLTIVTDSQHMLFIDFCHCDRCGLGLRPGHPILVVFVGLLILLDGVATVGYLPIRNESVLDEFDSSIIFGLFLSLRKLV
mgnify:CR=1 FL=1